MSKPDFDPEQIRNFSVIAYKERLGKNDAASMLAKDSDGGIKLRERAGSYDPLTRAYLKVVKDNWELVCTILGEHS